MISTYVSEGSTAPERLDLVLPGATVSLAEYRSAIRAARERALVAGFADAVGDLLSAGSETPDEAGILAALRTVAGGVDLALNKAEPDAYGHRPLWRDPETGVTLSVITLRYGQATEVHDHDGWGCALVVRGAERERRYVVNADGDLVLVESRHHGAGAAYIFDAGVIHEVIGRDPNQETVALHVLVPFHGRNRVSQLLPETERTPLAVAA